jgi:hypothetical protein
VFGALLESRQLTNLISQGWALLGRATTLGVGDHGARAPEPPRPTASEVPEPPPSTVQRLDAARDRLKASIAAPTDEEPGL